MILHTRTSPGFLIFIPGGLIDELFREEADGRRADAAADAASETGSAAGFRV